MVLDRRSFLKGFAGLPLLVHLQSCRNRVSPIGLQLFTIRSEMEKDFEGTLTRVAAIGYKEVEFAGYFDRSPQEVQAVLKRTGLTGVSSHVRFGDLGERWPEIVEAAQAIGHQFLVIVSIDSTSRVQPDIWQRASEQFNRAGEVCKEAGLQLAYHNHLFEFASSPGTAQLPYEILLESTEPSLVSMQMDLCWITAANQNPGSYFERYPGRFSSVHVKDLKRMPSVQGEEVPSREAVLPDLAEVGQGIIDWKDVLSRCWSAGIRHYFVEHEDPAISFPSIERSFRYLNTLRFNSAMP